MLGLLQSCISKIIFKRQDRWMEMLCPDSTTNHGVLAAGAVAAIEVAL
jgi:hypothetical protein